MATVAPADPLDDYIEAHVHGPISFLDDVEALVLDPCYRGSAIEAAAGRLGCAVEYHGGFKATAADLCHPCYRGPAFVELALSLLVDRCLDPGVLGLAARTNRYNEQDLKRVWHLLACFGTPEDG